MNKISGELWAVSGALFLFAWVLLSDGVLRNLGPSGLSRVDLPLLFLFWLAQRQSGIQIISCGLLCWYSRWAFDVSSSTVVGLPMLITLSLLYLVRSRVNLQALPYRCLWSAVGMLCFLVIEGPLRQDEGYETALLIQATILSGLLSAIVYPVFDQLLQSPQRRFASP